jgi:hypothetical protein
VVRGSAPGFADAVNKTSALPEELTGLTGVMFAQPPGVLDAVHGQAAAAMTPTDPLPPVEGTEPAVEPNA